MLPLLPLRPSPPVLIVLAHLRWGFVFQRPHQLMSRLAGRWEVWYVEEPVAGDATPHLEVRPTGDHLTVIVPHLAAHVDDADDPWQVLGPLLARHAAARQVSSPVVWLTTPMAWPAVSALEPACVVYDAMDDIAASRDTPHAWQDREQALLQRAALVFTAGPSLYEAWNAVHPNVHCVPSSVEVGHFAPPGTEPVETDAVEMSPPGQDELPWPRLGYFGVIDERVDLALIDTLASRHPEWQIVMVGPVVHVDPGALPTRANIHWLGMQPHARLPQLLAGWDLCLVPFFHDPAARSPSPTKILEYMAGEKPVVSTPIRDVVMLYGHVVEIAEAGDAFVEACERVLGETVQARCRRAMEMLTTVSRYSWERSADSVHRLIVEALPPGRLGGPPQDPEAPAAWTARGASPGPWSALRPRAGSD